MIDRFMIIRNCKTLAYKASLDDVKDLITRSFRKNKEDVYEVKDLEKDEYVCIKEFIASLRVVKYVKKPARKPKQGRNDRIDDQYSAWLGQQPCVVTGIKAKRGAGAHDMHCHHIHGRRGIHARNDYMQVPLLGNVHSWGVTALHNVTKEEFLKNWKHVLIGVENITEYFEDHARAFKEQYDIETGEN